MPLTSFAPRILKAPNSQVPRGAVYLPSGNEEDFQKQGGLKHARWTPVPLLGNSRPNKTLKQSAFRGGDSKGHACTLAGARWEENWCVSSPLASCEAEPGL